MKKTEKIHVENNELNYSADSYTDHLDTLKTKTIGHFQERNQ